MNYVTYKTPADTEMEHVRLNGLKRVNRLKINFNKKTTNFFSNCVSSDTIRIFKTAMLWWKHVNGNA